MPGNSIQTVRNSGALARQLLEVKQTRFLRSGEAAVDPSRHFATTN
jgi:hypothetical protein